MAGVSQSSIEIPLADIEVGPRLRLVDEAQARLIAESFAATGQLTPIEVRPHPDQEGRFRLTAGAHRFAAAGLAGWTHIRAEVRPGSEKEARLREIDENLCRHELTELDRAVFLAERRRLYLEIHPETGHGKRSARKDDKFVAFPTFAEDAAETLGVSPRFVQRAVRRAELLDPKVRERIAGTPFARRGTELDALCRHPASLQRKIVDLLLRDGSGVKSVAAANAKLSGKAAEAPDPADLQFSRLRAAWDAATSVVARRRFLEMLDARGELDSRKKSQKGQKDQAA